MIPICALQKYLHLCSKPAHAHWLHVL